MLGGISPYKGLKLRLSVRRNVRLPIAGEMVPESPWAWRSRATTLNQVSLAARDAFPDAVADAPVPGG